ncbi:glycine zipper 2TM domain-containing protein [Altererythrobacter sp. MTPC7]|uniref:glycine zipper 2TM domain-containing protein n=1 Tax=Altererythrobacter sp. MTPC7 TaxID=3056567 RepID=UPI0036F1E191
MISTAKTATLGLIAAAGMAISAPAAAAPAGHGIAANTSFGVSSVQPMGDMQFEHGRKHHKRYKRGRGHQSNYYDRGYTQQRAYYGEPVYRDTRVWRDRRDGQYYCQKKDGTTGLLIGGAAGALIGREVTRDRTLGAILGAAGGALLGREIDRGGSRCR